MRNGKWECKQCGEALDVPTDSMPTATFVPDEKEPRYRVIVLRGKEVHRCIIEPGDEEPSRVP